MTKKQKKGEKPHLKINTQIANSQVRKVTFIDETYHLQHAREYPILGCWVIKSWENSGITPVVVAREQSAKKVTYGVYLIDLYCLGLKDVVTHTDVSRAAFQRKLSHLLQGEPEQCSVEFAHEMIYGSIEYAKKYDLDPHPDFTRGFADQILDPPDAHPRKNKIQFGKEGKPFYVAGPYDDERKINRILSALKRTAGEGNYDYLVGLEGMDFVED